MKILKTLFCFFVTCNAAPNYLNSMLLPLPPSIVGGQDAYPGEFPYQISFQFYKTHLCGGSIVTAEHVITAAHCCEYGGGVKSTFRAVAGEHTLTKIENHEQMADIEEMYIHPKYNRSDLSNDICLLTLSNRFNLSSSYVSTINIASPNDDPKGNAVVTGWGYLKEGGPISEILQKVTVPIITNEKCKQYYNDYIIPVTNEMICAGYEHGGKDACQSDSGGPIVINEGGQNKLVGVVSWGEGCARPGYPGVYTRMSSFSNWVNDIISNSK